MNTIVAIVSSHLNGLDKRIPAPSEGLGFCQGNTLLTEVALLVSMALLGLAFLFTLPCFWLFVSDLVHKSNQKKEQREIKTEHEEEMLKDIRFSHLREAEERLRSNRVRPASSGVQTAPSTLPRPSRVFLHRQQAVEEEAGVRSEAQSPLSPLQPRVRPDSLPLDTGSNLPMMPPLRTSFEENAKNSLLARRLSKRLAQEAVDRVAEREAARNDRAARNALLKVEADLRALRGEDE